MSLIDYYLKEKFNPVPIEIKNKKSLSKHIKLRQNLIENHLKISLSLLKGKEILEFGPNRGENSMLFTIYGAKLFFVEPIAKSVEELKIKYKNHKLINSVKKIEKKTLESFKSNKKFDIVIAEGFLNTLKNRNKYLKKIFNFVNTQGLVILNYDDYFGSLIELIKSAVLKKYCKDQNIKLDSENSLNISKKLFYEDFKKFKNTRPFRAYWLDQLSCEFAKDVWKFEEIINQAKKSNFNFYSSSPLWNNSNYFTWYKSIDLEKKNNFKKNTIIKNWKKNINYFLTGRQDIILTKKVEKLYSETNKLIKQIIKYLNQNKDYKVKKMNNPDNSFFREINTVIDFLNDKKIKFNYKNLNTFRSFTGTNLHYICLKKDEKNITHSY